MAQDFSAPWDSDFAVGETGQGSLTIGRTYPDAQQSVYVPSAGQSAPPEAGEGPDYAVHDEFGIPGLSLSYIDQTPYEPPGVGPSVPWNAPPWKTEQVRGIDHGATRYFQSGNGTRGPDKGQFQTRDTTRGSYSRSIFYDELGRLVLADIDRPEHDQYFVVQRDNSPHWIDYSERPLLNNIATPAPYVQSEAPSQYVPNAAYPNLSRFNFAAEAYAQPPDPQQIVYGPGGPVTEYEGDWE